MNLIPVIPENFKMDGGACFGVVPKSIWSKHVSSDENNMVKLSSRCLLVDKGQKKILIDTGLGNKQSDKYYGYFHLFDRKGIDIALKEAGTNREEITDVIFTHLHFDHAGGALIWDTDRKTPVPVFPNAQYYCSKAQWDTANNPNPREAASYHPENYMSLYDQGRLELIHEEGLFCDGVYLEIKWGHTQGQIIPVIEYMGKKIVFMADFISNVMNIPLPYVPSFDVDPVKSMEEKKEFLKRALDHDYILFFEHDYQHECCNLTETEKGIRAKEMFTVSDIL